LKDRLLHLKPLYGVVAVVAAMVLVLGSASFAFAFDSGGKPGATGPDTITWTGQGADDGVLNTTTCEAGNPTPGDPANTPYLHWILTTDGGSASGVPPADSPVLKLGGTGIGTYDADKASGSAFHFVTPYFTPNGSLTADADFNVDSTGNGPWNLVISHGCSGGGNVAADSIVSTTVHDASENDVTPPATVPLGTEVHDSVNLTTDPTPVTLPGGSSITVNYFASANCTGDVALGDSATTDVSGLNSPQSLDGQVPKTVGAGQHSYQASFTSGDTDVVKSATGACEPFEVLKADTLTSTSVHNAAHQDITNQALAAPATVHDSALVGTQVGNFPITGNVTYSLYKSSDCTGEKAILDETVPVGTESTPTTVATPGSYGYQATYLGDSNYNGSTGVCEPFSVFQPGKTMGFWGNTNGQARIIANGGYLVNHVLIGRGSDIDTSGESLKVLPNTLNACGKGTPFIFSVGAQTATADCKLATGINKASLNTLAAQTLALGYNIKLVSGYSGQTVGALQCTGTGSVNDAFTTAVTLINGSSTGGGTTQGQIGAMNTLLGCLNREA
jgi:hypothetical protein